MRNIHPHAQQQGGKLYMRFVLLCLMSLTLTSCSNRGIAGPVPNWNREYLPFVESAIVPEYLFEDEEFDVILQVSALRNPNALRGFMAGESDPANYTYMPGDKILVSTWMQYDPFDFASSPLRSSISVSIPPLSAGTYILVIATADSEEWGGTEIKYYGFYGRDRPKHEHETTLEFPITVLPAEES